MVVDDDSDPTDPTSELRRRVIRQLDPNGQLLDPNADADPTADPAPIPSAAFDLSASDPRLTTEPVGTPVPLEPADTAPGTNVNDTANAPAVNDTANAPATNAPANPTTGLNLGTGTANWDADAVRKYFSSRGVTPFATSPDYWAAKWNEWGKNDPAYFKSRLAQADEFTGKGPNYDWQAAGQKDPGTAAQSTPLAAAPARPLAAAPATPLWAAQATPTQTSAPDPNIAAFFAENSAALKAQQQRQAETRAIIMRRLEEAGKPVDPNAANITAPLSAAQDQVSRATDAERTALAERLYATGGLNTGSLDQSIQQSSERNASALSSLRAWLITHEADAKRQELESLLELATASGDNEQARAIQAQLGALQAFLTQQGQGINLAEFGAQLNQNTALAGLRG